MPVCDRNLLFTEFVLFGKHSLYPHEQLHRAAKLRGGSGLRTSQRASSAAFIIACVHLCHYSNSQSNSNANPIIISYISIIIIIT